MTARRVTVALVLLALVVAARGLERHTTWYLASDQFAFLTQADDLRHGRVFHDPGEFAAVASNVPPGQTATPTTRPTCGVTGGSSRATRPASRSCWRSPTSSADRAPSIC